MKGKQLTAFAMVFYLVLAVFGTRPACASADRFRLDNALKNPQGWNANKENTVFAGGALTNTPKENETDVFAYTAEKFQDEIIEFDAEFEFVSAEKWQGLMLRAQSPENLPWKDNAAYLLVITEKQIELQRFHYRHAYLTVVPTPFAAGERVHIWFGARNTAHGVQIIFKVNGRTVISAVDTDEAAVTKAGYFAVYNSNTLRLLPYTGEEKPQTPAAYQPKLASDGLVGNAAEISYQYVDFDGGEEGESEFTWYRSLSSVDHFGIDALAPENYKETYLMEIDGQSGRSYRLTEEDVGCYILCGVRAKSKESGQMAEEVLSNSVYVDTIRNTLESGIYFLEGGSYAAGFGDIGRIDEANPAVAPFMAGGSLYVPLRFAAEHMGYQVEWDGQEKNCFCKKEGQPDMIYNVGGEVGAIIRHDRVFIPLEKLGTLFGVAAGYEPLYGLGILSDANAGLNPMEYKVFFRSIVKEIEQCAQ